MSAPGEQGRPLSPLERWYWIADQTSPLNVIGRTRVRGTLPEPLLRRALDALQARHPLLRVAIAADGARGRPVFVPCPRSAIPLRHARAIAADREPAPWEREVDERELPSRIDVRTGPLARAVVLTQEGADGTSDDVHDLLLTLSHCIADGTTALSLLREWIGLAARLRSGSPPAPGHPELSVVEAPFLPAPEDMFPLRHRGPAGAAATLRHQLSDQGARLRYRPRRMMPTQQVPFAQRRTRLLHRSLRPAELDRLVRRCRQEGVTVHAALSAAMVTAAACDTGEDGPGHFTIGSPVDFRGELVPPVPRNAVGAYVATLPSFAHYRPGAPMWPMARAIGRDLARRRQRGEHLSMINLLRWAGPRTPETSASFLRRVEAQGPGNLCLSNLGRHEFPSAVGPWRISDAQFIAGISVSGYFVATVNTTHGHLFCNFTYVDGIVPKARAEKLAAGCLNTLMSAVHA
ncbi:hypothetical protein HUT19_24975 [Streptomyces sp. NA02950]|uniref:phthiocerol/phthiodiolone dimycocerosyl transferase family protein n=1 Tax=Streptomyces sp. NA02950 TaxID=2742137 RepID=UPI001590F97A|nr:hypothetical protein [Streptomyces sp. NA02950]QKV94602.1 hypothetical protein HUT19_24975 [Streptomyces sp. NA02950]